jgi:two-component system, LuxR family, response regulator FixJ
LIAVVDDEEPVRKAVVRLFEIAGFPARGFASGVEFLEAVQAEPLDCVLLDLSMPGLSGGDVQRELTRRGSPVPVVIITGQGEPAVREECLRDGAVAYLYKPLDARVLLDTLKLAIGSSRPKPNGEKL